MEERGRHRNAVPLIMGGGLSVCWWQPCLFSMALCVGKLTAEHQMMMILGTTSAPVPLFLFNMGKLIKKYIKFMLI